MGSLNLSQAENIENTKLPSHKDKNLIILFTSEKIEEDAVTVSYEAGEAPPLPFAASEVHVAPVCGAAVLCAPREKYKPVYELTLDVKISTDTLLTSSGCDAPDTTAIMCELRDTLHPDDVSNVAVKISTNRSTISNNFSPGDTIGIIPSNKAKEVNFLLERIHLYHQADVLYNLENVQSNVKSKIPKHVPVKSTLRYTFTHCIDLRAVVKKRFLLELSHYTTNERERRDLNLLCTKEGSDLYTEYILNKSVCLLDLLRSFSSCQPSAECLLMHLPRLLPRPYSVINSRLRDENVVSICFSVMKLREGRYGLTTEVLEKIATEYSKKKNGTNGLENELERLTLNARCKGKVTIYLRKNMGFSFPSEKERVLMIGAGTGIAPYLGFLEERKIMKNKNPKLRLGETWLFYGCRNPDVDYIYKEQLQTYLNEEILTRLSTSYSRIENNVKYVQDAITANGAEVVEFIENGAYIFVCGDLSAMAKQVEEALTLCVERYTDRTRVEAVSYIRNLQTDKKYLLDIWS